MIRSVEDLFDAALRTEVLGHFKIKEDGLVRHDGFCSLVYEGFIDDKQVILKVSHSERLDLGALQDELSFVKSIAEMGGAVCAPITTNQQILIRPDGQGGQFFAYLYEYVSGVGLDDVALDTELMVATGHALGSFHAASKKVDCRQFKHRRLFTEQALVQYREILPVDEEDTIQCFDNICKQLNALSTSGEDFGMIHGDAHEGNFLADLHDVRLIDFDEIELGFYISDIAVVLESFCERDGNRTPAFVKRAFEAFLKGYARHIELSTLNWSTMGLFMQFSWISDHCLKHQLYASSEDERFHQRREMRRALFRRNFEEDSFLHQFNYMDIVEQFRHVQFKHSIDQ